MVLHPSGKPSQKAYMNARLAALGIPISTHAFLTEVSVALTGNAPFFCLPP
jgi:hypothetical protein